MVLLFRRTFRRLCPTPHRLLAPSSNMVMNRMLRWGDARLWTSTWGWRMLLTLNTPFSNFLSKFPSVQIPPSLRGIQAICTIILFLYQLHMFTLKHMLDRFSMSMKCSRNIEDSTEFAFYGWRSSLKSSHVKPLLLLTLRLSKSVLWWAHLRNHWSQREYSNPISLR